MRIILGESSYDIYGPKIILLRSMGSYVPTGASNPISLAKKSKKLIYRTDMNMCLGRDQNWGNSLRNGSKMTHFLHIFLTFFTNTNDEDVHEI
jgi:hypothetical protein